jgi:hypothetical protein
MSTPHTVALNPQTHQALRLRLSMPHHHAAGMMLCPVVSSEISAAARDYVIVFPVTADDVPQALLGTQAGRNAYLAASGHWLCRFVPAHIRRYPFMVGLMGEPTDGGGRRFKVLIDDGAPHFSHTEGEALFQPDGRPTPLLDKVQASLSRLQADHMATQGMVQQLDALGLLVERALQVRGQDGKEHRLTGFRLLDATRLQALEPQHLADLQRSGALLLAYAHLVSLANLHDGVLVQKPALAPSAALPAAGQDLGFSFFPDDTIDFSRFN